jgi:PAS domain S-box-containing protein
VVHHAVIGLDTENVIRFANDAALGLFGYDATEIIGTKSAILFQDEASSGGSSWQPSVAPEKPDSGIERAVFKTKAGSKVYGEILHSTQPRLGTGQALKFWIIRDITERVELQEEVRNKDSQLEELWRDLKLADQKLRKFIDNAVDAVITIDEDSRILDYNKAAEAIFGYTAEELRGEIITEIIPCLRCEQCERDFTGCFENWLRNAIGKIKRVSGTRKNGERIQVELSLSDTTIHDERHLTAIIRDITENEELKSKLKEKTKQVELANLELEEANKLKSEFLANASHELRTPLNSIIGFLKLITDGLCESEEEEIEFVGNALDSSNHLLSLINDILDISKIEAGKMTLDLEEIDPGKIFDDLYILTHVQAQQKGLHLDFRAPEGVSVHVRADYGKLKQILLNLIGNSIKFTEKGSILVSAEPHPQKGFVEFFVKDTGIGVSQEKMKKLFNKFVQGDGSMTRKYGGTGLGLTITKSLVELMGGIIEMTSEGEGKGTTVSFTVPTFTADDSLFERNDTRSQLEEVTGGEQPLILVVEDDPIIRSLIQDILEQQDFSTVCAATADDAVAIARKSHPSVMTLDFGLLAREHAVLQNGWDIIRVLSKDNETKDIKYIIISGYDEPVRKKVREESLDFQPVFLQKPFDAKILVETVKSLLSAPQKA